MPKLRYFLFALLLAALGTTAYQMRTQRAATLNRIAALDACLAASNEQRAREAAETVSSLSTAVRKNHNLPRDMAVLRQAQQIRARAQGLADTLRRLRQDWPATGTPATLAQLSAHLSYYLHFIEQFIPPPTPLIPDTMAAYSDAVYLNAVPPPTRLPPLNQPSPARALTGWLGQFDLQAEPTQAALATLTKLENQVRQYEAKALEAQNRKIGSGCCMCFDRIGVFASSASQTVAPDAVYEARLFLAPSATGLKQVMSADGRLVPIDPHTNHGLVRFRIPAPPWPA